MLSSCLYIFTSAVFSFTLLEHEKLLLRVLEFALPTLFFLLAHTLLFLHLFFSFFFFFNFLLLFMCMYMHMGMKMCVCTCVHMHARAYVYHVHAAAWVGQRALDSLEIDL